jgi:uncharacterized protein
MSLLNDAMSRADDLATLLRQVRTIAVVGASGDSWRPSFGVSAYLKRVGYRILPVNPTLIGTTLHDEPFRASLRDIGEPIDLVNVFRRPEFVPDVVEDAIAIKAPAIWLQLGVRNPGAAARAQDAGMTVVMDRCISVEHRRLLGQFSFMP